MSEFFDIPEGLEAMARQAEEKCAAAFARVDDVAGYTSDRVLAAFRKNRISEANLHGTTGYGYDDHGRDALDRVFAEALGAPDALVRHTIVSGTHALSAALFGVLRPGDVLFSATGRPYDTMEEAIGIRGQGHGSLKDFGVKYTEAALLPDGSPDIPAIASGAKAARMVYIQRSRGYSLRPSLEIATIERIAAAAHAANPEAIVFVDNCYGEFVEKREPTAVGADLMAGSLIKNAGGGVARTGGYIAGRGDLVELCGFRLTSPGIGREAGCTLDTLRDMYLGLFLAPNTVACAVKTAIFAAALFPMLGMEVLPAHDAPRTDIIQSVLTGSPEAMCAFCKGIQSGSPVDSFVTPEPWAMPGYGDDVIMAAGTFTSGASIELSADGPIRPPYAVWLQGGLTYHSGRTGVLLAAAEILKLHANR